MRWLCALTLILLAAGPLRAQDATLSGAEDEARPAETLSLGQVRSPILTVDPDRLYSESLYGERVTAEVRARAEALDLENQQIQASLTDEERSLTLLRPTLSVAEFQVQADAFDAKVQEIRIEQDNKERVLQQAVGQGQAAFLEAATPILAQIMIDSGAAVILDRRSVFLGVDVVDITDRAIIAIDSAIGDGSQLSDDDAPDPSGVSLPQLEEAPPQEPDDGAAAENP